MSWVLYSTLASGLKTHMVLTGNVQRPNKWIHQHEPMYVLIPSTVDASMKAQYVLNTRKLILSWNTFQTSLHFSVVQTKTCMRLEETEGFSLQWQSARDVHPTKSTLAAGHPWVCTHISLSPCFLAEGSSLLLKTEHFCYFCYSEHFFSYILKEREQKKEDKQNKKGGFLSSWEKIRAFTTAQTKVHGGVLIMNINNETLSFACVQTGDTRPLSILAPWAPFL